MNLGLSGKVAVVLAASAGIGRGIALALAKEGCHLALCARREDRLRLLSEEIKQVSNINVFTATANVANVEELNLFFDGVFSNFKSVDILVTNAGGPPPGRCFDFSDEDYLHAFNLTLLSVIRSCRRVIPFMVEKNWGRIINVQSTSIKEALENMVLSNVFRSGVAAFAKSLSIEYAERGVRVHTLLSGPFMTDRVYELGQNISRKAGISFEEWKRNAEASTPLKRFGKPEEYGDLVAFLASERADYLTGTCIAIDGGVLKTIC